MIWNPMIKSLLTLFVISMSFDLLSRTVLAPKIQKPKAQQKPGQKQDFGENQQDSEGLGTTKEPSMAEAAVSRELTEEEKAEEAEFLIQPGEVLGTMKDLYSVEIEYCGTCGYQKKFEEYKEKLENFKNVTVEGRVAPKPFDKKIIENLLFALQMIGIAVIVCKAFFLYSFNIILFHFIFHFILIPGN